MIFLYLITWISFILQCALGILSLAAGLYLELFICFLQAFIFTFLTVLFISMVAHHHDHDHPEESELDDEHQMDMDKLMDPSRITPMSSPA